MAELSFAMRLKRRGAEFAMAGAIPLEGVTAVMGPSGSGKTTLLSMLAGLEPGTRGEIAFGDTQWLWGRRAVRPEARRIGFVFQEGRLFDHMSVAQNVGYGARRRGVPAVRIQGVVEALGLAPLMPRRPATLSGGEARRVALARALASGPEILFMDEPLSGLDDASKAQLLPYLARAVSQSGIPVVYVTHSRAEVTQLADRVLVLSGGRVTGWGEPPVTLDVTVLEEDRPGRLRLELGEARFTLPGHGAAGDARRVALPPDGAMISRDAPGPGSALSVLPATLVDLHPRPGGADLTLSVAGQRIAWLLPADSALARHPPPLGERLWLTILHAYLR